MSEFILPFLSGIGDVFVVGVAYMLWKMDRRILKIETKLGIEDGK